MIVECIKDDGYNPNMLKWIHQFPVKGQNYYVRKRVHTKNGLGFLLDEIVNPIMPNGEEPNFHHSRFREIKVDVNSLLKSDEKLQHT